MSLSSSSRSGGVRCFVTFPSVHHVLAAEEKLLAVGASIRLVQIPRELSSDCGTALEFDCNSVDAVRRRLREAGLKYEAIVRLAGSRAEALEVKDGRANEARS